MSLYSPDSACRARGEYTRTSYKREISQSRWYQTAIEKNSDDTGGIGSRIVLRPHRVYGKLQVGAHHASCALDASAISRQKRRL